MQQRLSKVGEKSSLAVFPGTFDPFTLGHIDLIERASHLFDTIIIAIAESVGKSPLFSVSKRVTLAKQIFEPLPNVKVDSFSGLLVDFMKKNEASIILRGIRTSGDMEYEFQLATANRCLKPDIETIFLKPDEKFAHISSSIVREIAMMGGDISPFVPPLVVAEFNKKR